MTRLPVDPPTRTRTGDPEDATVDRDERWIRAMADSFGNKVASDTVGDDEVLSAALRSLLDYGEVVSVEHPAPEPH